MNDIELGEMRQQVNDTRNDVTEIKGDLKAVILRLDTLTDFSDNRYYTRKEGRVVTFVLSFLVLSIGLWDTIKSHIRS